jgi:hypothetical protein
MPIGSISQPPQICAKRPSLPSEARVERLVYTYDMTSQIDFHIQNELRVSNIISTGADGPEDLYLTFAFARPHRDVAGQSAEEAAAALEAEKKNLWSTFRHVPHHGRCGAEDES